MTELALLVPGGPLPRTGGTLYNRAVTRALRSLGVGVRTVPLTGRWPMPSPRDAGPIEQVLSNLPAGIPVLADGLIWTGLGPLLPALTRAHRCTVIVHSPLFRESGIPPERAHQLRAAEASALALAHSLVATGQPTLHDVQQAFSLDATCAFPGTHPAPFAPAHNPHALVCVATITPRKGHDRLLEGLATVRDLPWHLSCAGATHIAPTWTAHVQQLAHRLGLSDRVDFLGELDAAHLDRVLQQCGLLVHAAHYEAWGMAITEALARGIPVVSTPAGALHGLQTPAAVPLPAAPTPLQWERALRGAMGPGHGSLRSHARALSLPSWTDTARDLLAAMQLPVTVQPPSADTTAPAVLST